MKTRELIKLLELENPDREVVIKTKRCQFPLDVLNVVSVDGFVHIEADLDNEGTA